MAVGVLRVAQPAGNVWLYVVQADLAVVILPVVALELVLDALYRAAAQQPVRWVNAVSQKVQRPALTGSNGEYLSFVVGLQPKMHAEPFFNDAADLVQVGFIVMQYNKIIHIPHIKPLFQLMLNHLIQLVQIHIGEKLTG